MKFTKKGVLAVASFVLLVLQAFGLKINVPVVNEIIAAAASVLVMFGIIADSTEKKDDGSAPPTLSPLPSLPENKDGEDDKAEDKGESAEPPPETSDDGAVADGDSADEAGDDPENGDNNGIAENN